MPSRKKGIAKSRQKKAETGKKSVKLFVKGKSNSKGMASFFYIGSLK